MISGHHIPTSPIPFLPWTRRLYILGEEEGGGQRTISDEKSRAKVFRAKKPKDRKELKREKDQEGKQVSEKKKGRRKRFGREEEGAEGEKRTHKEKKKDPSDDASLTGLLQNFFLWDVLSSSSFLYFKS